MTSQIFFFFNEHTQFTIVSDMITKVCGHTSINPLTTKHKILQKDIMNACSDFLVNNVSKCSNSN